MRFFNNLKIRNKTILSFVVVLVLAVGLGLYAIERLQFIGTQVTNVEQNVLAFPQLAEMIGDANRLRGFAGEMILADPGAVPAIAAEEDAIRKAYASQWDNYGPTMVPGDESAAGNQFNGAFKQLSADASQIAETIANNHASNARALFAGGIVDWPLGRSNRAS